MCKQERLDGDGKLAQVGTKPHMEVLPGGITSPAMRKLITNVRWTIGLLSTINFLVLRLASYIPVQQSTSRLSVCRRCHAYAYAKCSSGGSYEGSRITRSMLHCM